MAADNPFGKLGAANINNALKTLNATKEWMKGLRDDLPKDSPAYAILDKAAKDLEETMTNIKNAVWEIGMTQHETKD